MEGIQSFYERVQAFFDQNFGFLYIELFELGSSVIRIHNILFPILFFILLVYLSNKLRSVLVGDILPRYIHEQKVYRSIGYVTRNTILLVGTILILYSAGIDYEPLNFRISLGKDGDLHLFDILRLVFFISLLSFFTGKFKAIFVKQILSRYSDDIGVSQSIGTIIQYMIVFIGSLLIIQNSGINLGSLNLLAGALGVGIGFGLQSIANNFISGIIILFERPIKIGDRIEVGGVSGDVVKVSPRATTVNTNDNISIIIPNSEFINKQVINWSHNDRNVRFRIPVGVSYKEDPEVVKKILMEVADEHTGVLKRPAPDVLFIQYGESSLDFELVVWTNRFIDKPIVLKSELYYNIFEKFKENNIEIPYPQRDLHLKSGFDRLKSTSSLPSGN